MLRLWDFLNEINDKVNYKIEDIETIEYSSIREAIQNVRLEKGVWNKVPNVIAVFSDLLDSTGISNEKRKKTYSKILEYLNYPFIQIHKKFGAEFFDIKGDGGLALYSGYEAEVRAFLAAETYKTFIEKKANNYFSTNYGLKIVVGIGIAKGELWVKKIGSRGDGKNFYVWSGSAINNAALISKDLKRIKRNISTIGVTEDIYSKLNRDKIRDYLIYSCECTEKTLLWKTFFVEGISNFKYYCNESNWCDKHGEGYLNKVFEILKLEIP